MAGECVGRWAAFFIPLTFSSYHKSVAGSRRCRRRVIYDLWDLQGIQDGLDGAGGAGGGHVDAVGEDDE